MVIAGFALRDILIVIAALVGIYLIVLTLRLLQVGRQKRLDAAADEDETEQDAPAAEEEEEAAEPAPWMANPPPLRPAEPAAAGFGAELTRTQQEAELRQLREEVAQLRGEVAALRGEVGGLRAARHVSPQYEDAMSMAQRGLTAQDVADRCGISLGEAELVWALSRGATNFDEEDDHGFESGPKHARSA